MKDLHLVWQLYSLDFAEISTVEAACFEKVTGQR
jgi:hypothetical protein